MSVRSGQGPRLPPLDLSQPPFVPFDTAFPPRHPPPSTSRGSSRRCSANTRKFWGEEIEQDKVTEQEGKAHLEVNRRILEPPKEGRRASVVRVCMQDAHFCLCLPREGGRHAQEDKTSRFICDNGGHFQENAHPTGLLRSRAQCEQ